LSQSFGESGASRMKRQRRQRREIGGLICHGTREVHVMQKRLIASGRACSRSIPDRTVRFGRLLLRTKHEATEYGSQQTMPFPIDVARSGKQLLKSGKINGTVCTTNATFLKIDAISDGFSPRSAVLMACSLALFSPWGEWGGRRVRGRLPVARF